jgi:hypothetical protein
MKTLAPQMTTDKQRNPEAKGPVWPQYIKALLGSCPPIEKGFHNWVYHAALRLHRFSPNKDDIAKFLEKCSASANREPKEGEIWNAINDSERWLAKQKGKPLDAPRGPKWPERNPAAIAAIVREGPTLAGLEAMSPVRHADEAPNTEEIIDVLFPDNPLLCAGTKKENALTRSREEWRGFLENQQFIVPSPMSAVRGKTKAGTDSMRCLGNTGPRRFLVVEFDQGDFDEHAALLRHLAKFAPLALVVHSGNKSLHGWFYCAGQPEETVLRFFRYAVSLGADPATWTPCQFVRLPDGRRDNGKRQRVVYFNPQILEAK